ncbi:MAG: SEC-C metal-binding domain-containing protein [Polyangiaceae bacterium]|nr:SEC-C metal-binding domain-containing protein [Polyangiaceae bacterium]
MESGASSERAKVGRNAPCPCGSGKKYKKCCIDVVEAKEFDESEFAGVGGVRDFADFAAPLLESANKKSHKEVETATTFAAACWNFALMRDEQEREKQINDLVATLPNELPDDVDGNEARDAFRALINYMIERHHAMFPEMHRDDHRSHMDASG